MFFSEIWQKVLSGGLCNFDIFYKKIWTLFLFFCKSGSKTKTRNSSSKLQVHQESQCYGWFKELMTIQIAMIFFKFIQISFIVNHIDLTSLIVMASNAKKSTDPAEMLLHRVIAIYQRDLNPAQRLQVQYKAITQLAISALQSIF